jgi:hypothetical protein
MDRFLDCGIVLACQLPFYIRLTRLLARQCRAVTVSILSQLVQGLCQVTGRQHMESRQWRWLSVCTRIIRSAQ